MIMLKTTKNQGLALSLENTFLEKPQWGPIDHPPTFLGLKGIISEFIFIFLQFVITMCKLIH